MEFINKIADKLADYSGSIVLALIVLVVGLILIKLCMKIAEKALGKTKLDPSIHKFILSVFRILLIVVLIVIILSCLWSRCLAPSAQQLHWDSREACQTWLPVF